jgi:hypothetical protein
MGWFGQVDDADERWKMNVNVEKVVRQVGLGILRQYKVGFGERFLFFSRPQTIPHLILTFVSGRYFTCRVNQYRRTSP